MLIIRGLRMWKKWCFHLNTMFTPSLERMKRIKSLLLNLQQSQEALADHQEQGQYPQIHQCHPQKKEPLRTS